MNLGHATGLVILSVLLGGFAGFLLASRIVTSEGAARCRRLARAPWREVSREREDGPRRSADPRFDRLADSMSTALLCTDHEGRITSWNRAAETIFGYSRSEAIGQYSSILAPKSMRPADRAEAVRGRTRLAGKTFESTAMRRNGEVFPVEISLSTWTEDGRPAFGSIVRDISDRIVARRRLHALAYTDQLTGLPNRQAFSDALRSIAQSSASAGATLLLLDLDRFKEVNDSRGHSSGDVVLIACADRLRESIPEGATVSRLGGDEFAILLPGGADVRLCIERILGTFTEPVHVAGRPFLLGISIGVVSHPEHPHDADELLVKADLALYRAKSLGGSRCEYFTPALAQALQVRQSMERELLRAHTRGEFELFYQPLVRLSDGQLAGAEALVRWAHPVRGLLAPDVFLPILEVLSLAESIGTWVLETACTQAAEWNRAHGPLRISVNLFAAQFHSGKLEARVAEALASSGLAPERLELEITENIALANDESMVGPLRALRALGVGIAFDDFGTGFGSLSMLKRFPVTRLKIDRSFVQDLTENRDDLGIVGAILALGRSLRLNVIAEGVETEDQIGLLAALGCEEGQGYYFGRPMPAAEFETVMLAQPLRSVVGWAVV